MSIMTPFGRHHSIRDRLPVVIGLAGVVGIAWLYLVSAAMPTPDMSMADMGMISTYRASASRRSPDRDRKSTRLNSSHTVISYAVFCLKKKKYQDKALSSRY